MLFAHRLMASLSYWHGSRQVRGGAADGAALREPRVRRRRHEQAFPWQKLLPRLRERRCQARRPGDERATSPKLRPRLAPAGSAITIPHGNPDRDQRVYAAFAKGQGVFLAEFGLLEPADDVGSLLERLGRDQRGAAGRVRSRLDAGPHERVPRPGLRQWTDPVDCRSVHLQAPRGKSRSLRAFWNSPIATITGSRPSEA